MCEPTNMEKDDINTWLLCPHGYWGWSSPPQSTPHFLNCFTDAKTLTKWMKLTNYLTMCSQDHEHVVPRHTGAWGRMMLTPVTLPCSYHQPIRELCTSWSHTEMLFPYLAFKNCFAEIHLEFRRFNPSCLGLLVWCPAFLHSLVSVYDFTAHGRADPSLVQ